MRDLDDALRAVKELPKLPSSRRDIVPHPWPIASSKAYGSKVTKQQALDAPVEKVSLAKLHGVQRGVHRQKLAEYMLRGGRAPEGTKSAGGYPRDLPIVVKAAGKLYVHDGHHRLASQAMMGADEADARVVTISKHPLKTWSDAA